MVYTRLLSITINCLPSTFPIGYIQLGTLALVSFFSSVPTAQSSITVEITMVVFRDQHEDVIFSRDWFNVCSQANYSAAIRLLNSKQSIYLSCSPRFCIRSSPPGMYTFLSYVFPGSILLLAFINSTSMLLLLHCIWTLVHGADATSNTLYAIDDMEHLLTLSRLFLNLCWSLSQRITTYWATLSSSEVCIKLAQTFHSGAREKVSCTIRI